MISNDCVMKTISLKIDDSIFSETDKIFARIKNRGTDILTRRLNIIINFNIGKFLRKNLRRNPE